MSFDLDLTNNDLGIKADGSIRIVEKVNKLKQDIVKILLTPIGTMRFHPWYGSQITNDVVGNAIPDNILFHDLSTAVQESLSRLQTLQRAQSTTQRVTMSELLGSVKDVMIQRNIRDPRQVNVIILVISKDFNAVEESFTIA